MTRNFKAIDDLATGDFSLSVNRNAVTPCSVTHVRQPLSLGILIEVSGSMIKQTDSLTGAIGALKRLQDGVSPGDEFFLELIRGQSDLRCKFTDDITKQLQGLRIRPKGRTALYDSIQAAMIAMGKAQNRNRALFVITDGLDNASQNDIRALRRSFASSPVPLFVLTRHTALPLHYPGGGSAGARSAGGVCGGDRRVCIWDIGDLVALWRGIGIDQDDPIAVFAFLPEPSRPKRSITEAEGGGPEPAPAAIAYLSRCISCRSDEMSRIRKDCLLILLTLIGSATCWWPGIKLEALSPYGILELACCALCSGLAAVLSPQRWSRFLLASSLGAFAGLCAGFAMWWPTDPVAGPFVFLLVPVAACAVTVIALVAVVIGRRLSPASETQRSLSWMGLAGIAAYGSLVVTVTALIGQLRRA